MRSLVFPLLLLFGGVAQAAGWMPFLPYDMDRTHNQAMEEFADRTDPVTTAFWREMLKGVPQDKREQAKQVLIDKGVEVTCDSDVKLTIARVKPSGRVDYFERPCKPGEKIVTVKTVPKYSAYCGNPIKDLEKAKPNWVWKCVSTSGKSTVEYWKEENGWYIPGHHFGNYGVGLLHSEQSLPIRSGSGELKCKQVKAP